MACFHTLKDPRSNQLSSKTLGVSTPRLIHQGVATPTLRGRGETMRTTYEHHWGFLAVSLDPGVVRDLASRDKGWRPQHKSSKVLCLPQERRQSSTYHTCKADKNINYESCTSVVCMQMMFSLQYRDIGHASRKACLPCKCATGLLGTAPGWNMRTSLQIYPLSSVVWQAPPWNNNESLKKKVLK